MLHWPEPYVQEVGKGTLYPRRGGKYLWTVTQSPRTCFSHTAVSSSLTKLVPCLWRLPSLLIHLWMFESQYWTRKLREVMLLAAPGNCTHEWSFSISQLHHIKHVFTKFANATKERERERKHIFNLIFRPGFYWVFIPQCLLKIMSFIAWDLEAISSSVAPKGKREGCFHWTWISEK